MNTSFRRPDGLCTTAARVPATVFGWIITVDQLCLATNGTKHDLHRLVGRVAAITRRRHSRQRPCK